MVLSVCVWLMVWTCGWGWAGPWLGLRGPTQFCCSLSRVVVSSAPSSEPAEGGECWDLEEVRVGWGVEVAVLMEEGGAWEMEVWLLGGGVAWGRDWLGLRPADGAVWGMDRLVGGSWVFDGWRFTGGVASGSGTRVPGGVMGGNETDVSRRVWLPSGVWGELSSLDARSPFWYWARVIYRENTKIGFLFFYLGSKRLKGYNN